MKIRTLILISWVIIALIGLFSFTSNAKASASFELDYPGKPGSLFSETNLAPLDSITKQITVKNLTDSTQKFALDLENLLGTPDTKLASVLFVEISRSGNVLYTNHLANLSDSETYLEDIPGKTTYTYDIKVTMADVGNDYQDQEVKFDMIFGWLGGAAVAGVSQEGPKGVLGEAVGPRSVAGAVSALPETGANALVSVFSVIILLSFLSVVNMVILKSKGRKK